MAGPAPLDPVPLDQRDDEALATRLLRRPREEGGGLYDASDPAHAATLTVKASSFAPEAEAIAVVAGVKEGNPEDGFRFVFPLPPAVTAAVRVLWAHAVLTLPGGTDVTLFARTLRVRAT